MLSQGRTIPQHRRDFYLPVFSRGLSVGLAAGMLACGAPRRPPKEQLHPSVVISTDADPTWGEFRSLAKLGKRLAILDRQAKRILVFDTAGNLVATVGKSGSGPGELDDPVVLAAGDDSVLSVMDVSRRRLIAYSVAGTALSDRPLNGGPSLHAAMGRLLYLSPDTLLDYWLAANGPFPLPDDLFDTLHVVTAIHRDGTLWPGGWGAPIHPTDESAMMLRMGLQMGDMAVWRDSLYLLRSVPGIIEVYALQRGSYQPVRSFTLSAWRRPEAPHEIGTSIIQTPDGDRFADAGEVSLGYVATVLAVDSAGAIYVVQPTNDVVGPRLPSPHEVLAIYLPDGTLQHAYRIPSLATRDLQVLANGTVALLGISEDDSLGGRAIMLFRQPFELAQ